MSTLVEVAITAAAAGALAWSMHYTGRYILGWMALGVLLYSGLWLVTQAVQP